MQSVFVMRITRCRSQIAPKVYRPAAIYRKAMAITLGHSVETGIHSMKSIVIAPYDQTRAKEIAWALDAKPRNRSTNRRPACVSAYHLTLRRLFQKLEQSPFGFDLHFGSHDTARKIPPFLGQGAGH